MIEFNDLKPLHASLAGAIRSAMERVTARGWYILGPEVKAFENAFAAYHGVDHAVGVANGTDAIELALRACGIGPGDDVITVAHTAVATVCAVERAGARPVFVDIDPRTYTMDPDAAAAAITPRTRALLPVHLYGHPCHLRAIQQVAERHRLLLIEDCAQAHGARYGEHLVGTIGQIGCFSFYPTKNLGALGDGGAVITNDAQIADRVRRLRNYGQQTRYLHGERGINSRLDEIQAAILGIKLGYLDSHNEERRRLAWEYSRQLYGVTVPVEHVDTVPVRHVYHLYVVRHPRREWLRAEMARAGVGTLVHYPVPVHRQEAYADLGYVGGSLPETERAANEVLSLPMYVGMPPEAVAAVSRVVSRIAHGRAA